MVYRYSIGAIRLEPVEIFLSKDLSNFSYFQKIQFTFSSGAGVGITG